MTQDAALLSVRNLDVRFGALMAVSGVSFHVGANEAVGLVGPNGAGKTTTFNTISGMQPPTGGHIAFNGRDITGLPPERIAQAGITRTFQNVRLFADLSVFDNVMMGSYAAGRCGVLAAMMRLGRHARMEAQAREQARHWIARLGLSAYADLPAGALPLGLQRIAEVARALAGNPQLVLLDEPAAGLNGSEKMRLAELLRDAMRESGCALLLIEHDMSLVMGLVDRIVVLDFGRKLAEGSPADIANDPDVIRVYLGV